MSNSNLVTRSQQIGTITGCIVDVAERSATGELKGSLRVFQKGRLLSSADFAEVSWSELHTKAKAMANQLVSRGVRKGSHVAILGNTSLDLITAIQSVWLCGATVVIIPLPYRLSTLSLIHI